MTLRDALIAGPYTAERFERLDGRLDRMESRLMERMVAVGAQLDAIARKLGVPPEPQQPF